MTTPEPLSTRERILEAAERCLERYGIKKTTLADVAEEAGVARVTVYRQFADRDALFVDTSLFILERRWREIAQKLEGVDDPGEWVLQALLLNLKMMLKDTAEGRYQEKDARGEGMSIALSPAGLECIAVWLRPLLDGIENAVSGSLFAEGIAEWMHWQSFIMDSGRSQRLKTAKQWRDWLEPQIRTGLLR
jgi:AcrR family transcriptional regulator